MTEQNTDHADDKPTPELPKMQFLYSFYNKSDSSSSSLILSDLHFISWMFAGIIAVFVFCSVLIPVCSFIISSSYNILMSIVILSVLAIVLEKTVRS